MYTSIAVDTYVFMSESSRYVLLFRTNNNIVVLDAKLKSSLEEQQKGT
jgi:hypothetical protein